MENLWQRAVREKWVFPSPLGDLDVIRLSELPCLSRKSDGKDLNTVAITLHNATEDSKEMSFVKKATRRNSLMLDKLELVKDLIQTKEREEEIAQEAKAVREEATKIRTLLIQKKDEKLSNMEIEDLEALLSGLEKKGLATPEEPKA